MCEKWSAGVLHRMVGGRRSRILSLSVVLSVALLGCVDRSPQQPSEEPRPERWRVHAKVVEPPERSGIPFGRFAIPRKNGAVVWEETVLVQEGFRRPPLPEPGAGVVATLEERDGSMIDLVSFEPTAPPKPTKASLAWLGLDDEGRGVLEGKVLEVRKVGDGVRVLIEKLAPEGQRIEARRVRVLLDPETKVRLFARRDERLSDLLRKYPRWRDLGDAEPSVRADVRVREDGLHVTRLEVLEY